MSKPITEPSQGRENAYLGWNDNQLQRRPPPTVNTVTGSLLWPRPAAELFTETVNNAVPASDTLFTLYPFDLTWGGTTPVGWALGDGDPSLPAQYFTYDVDNCAIGLPFGGTVFVKAQAKIGAWQFDTPTWDQALYGQINNTPYTFDPMGPQTIVVADSVPDNVSIYDGAVMLSPQAVEWSIIWNTNREERQWLQFFYMHNGPAVEDANFSGILVEVLWWPTAYQSAPPPDTGTIATVFNMGALMVTPESCGTGDTLTLVGQRDEKAATVTDWIACFALGDDNDAFLTNWIYTSSGTQVAGATPFSSGTLSMVAPADPGEYEFRWFAEDGFIQVGQSTFTVVVT